MGIVLINYRKRGIDMSLFRVAIHYGINSNGFLSYDTEAKTVSVELPEQEWADKVIAYLNDEHAIEHATGRHTYRTVNCKTIRIFRQFQISINTHVGSYRRTSRLEPPSVIKMIPLCNYILVMKGVFIIAIVVE